jgi:hypothetical protein
MELSTATGLLQASYQRPNDVHIAHLAHLSYSRVPALLRAAVLNEVPSVPLEREKRDRKKKRTG